MAIAHRYCHLLDLCERFPPMMRATSWSNKHADATYPEVMRMTKRMRRDWVRQLFALNPKYFIRNGKQMTASQVRESCSLFKAWLGKVLSDDIVSHTFTLLYIARIVSLKLLASPGFLATAPGKVLSLGTLALAGTCAGASVALGFQTLRGCKYRAEHPGDEARGETLVKSRQVWQAETGFEKKKIALIREFARDCKEISEQDMNDAIELMEADQAQARAKSEFLAALKYKFLCLFRGKSPFGSDDNGEVAGKVVQTISGFFAKMLCLLPATLFGTFLVAIFAGPNASLAQQLGLLVLAPLILIIGFGLRKELELAVMAMIGLVMGIVDVASFQITQKDKYQYQKKPARPSKPSPVLRDWTSGVRLQSPVSPTSQKLKGKNQPDGALADSGLSTSSSEQLV